MGALESIPASIRIRSYNALCRIGQNNLRPQAMARSTRCLWGITGAGKSREAWEEAGPDGYSKDPRSKFWCGYRGQEHVVIDEFRGGIDISHLLRWLTDYPLSVETKGGAAAYCAKRIWITSNLHPNDWYPDADEGTRAALLRRMELKYFDTTYVVSQ